MPAIKLITLLLALVGLVMGVYERVKGPQSNKWYKFYLIVVLLTTIGSMLIFDVIGFIIWSVILGVTYWRAKKMGINLF